MAKNTFTAEEQAAMKERARELKAEARAGKKREEGEADVLAKIKELPASEAKIAMGLHHLILEHAPELMPKTWYGMPAYARNDKVLCFYQSSAKFGARYGTLGFNDEATLDDGTMWPTVFALKELDAANTKRIIALIKKATA